MGTYTVHYTKDGYKPNTQPDEFFFDADQTLPDVTLKPGGTQEVSGTVSGLWDNYYDYYVVGDIEVPAGETLTIEPGLRVEFKGDYQFKVYGKLIAQGAEGDSIYFTSGQVPYHKGDWKNIYFNGEECDGSLLEYCVVEYGGNADDCQLYCHDTYSADIQILNSAVRYSSFRGIYTSQGHDLLIDASAVYENEGFGIYFHDYDSSTVSNSLIYGNVNGGVHISYKCGTHIQQNEIYNNSGVGIYFNNSDVIVSHNRIYDNQNEGISGGNSSCEPSISFNRIYNNSTGIYFYGAYPDVFNNTIFSNNDGTGISIGNYCTHAKIRNNIIANNYYGIQAAESEPEIISYNDIYGNTEENLYGDYLPDNIGVLVTKNANGDSTDTYYNLFIDPEMTDPNNGDFSLLATSPCIDAGDPALDNDADGTIADIGALYYDQGGAPAPTADFSADPLSGTAPLAVDFTPITTGPITDYLWNFGDGYTSTRSHPVHTYATEGTFTVSLQVTGPGGSDTEVKTDYITVDPYTAPPSANFTADKTTVYPDEVIQFTNQSTGTIDTYAWDFGDTGTSSLENPTHSYSAAGKYTVSLTVDGTNGSDTETKTDYITVLEEEEVAAAFTPTETAGIAPYSVQFTNQSIGSINSYLWDFGDTESSTEENPLHVYADTGSYVVELIVYGQINNDTAYGAVQVTTAEPLILSINDVENDQGGKLLVKWQCSGYDGPVQATVSGYTVWEEIDNLWTAVGALNARQQDEYSFMASTVNDSCEESFNWTKFKITAHTTDPQVFYDSQIDSGYSVDNIAPEAPENLAAAQTVESVNLEWDESAANDFSYFMVFRDEELLGNTVEANYEDSDVQTGNTYIYKTQAVDCHGNISDLSEPLEVHYDPSAIPDIGEAIPDAFMLMQNYPNPFNPKTVIGYQLPVISDVELSIYNLLGQKVATLVSEKQPAGYFYIEWDASGFSSGIYLYCLQAGMFIQQRKMLIVK